MPMRTVIHQTAKLFGGLALLAGMLLAMSAPARAQTVTAEPQTVIVAKDATQGATTITWDAGAGIKNVGVTLWQQINGGKETLVAAQAKGSQSVLIGAGQTRVFKLRNFVKGKVLASVTVTATESTVSFAGMWAAGQKIGDGITVTFKLAQTGNKVTGYAFFQNNEKQKLDFEGVVSGNTLRFQVSCNAPTCLTLREPLSGEFVMAQDGKSFTGNVGKGSTVIATVLPNFAGVWHAKWGESFMELIFQQSGTQVTGELRGFSYPVVIREGIVDGNTLRFQVMRVENVNRPDLTIPMGTGELVMDEGGKLFTGQILGTATRGATLIAR